jgi:hypothetical protein
MLKLNDFFLKNEKQYRVKRKVNIKTNNHDY